MLVRTRAQRKIGECAGRLTRHRITTICHGCRRNTAVRLQHARQQARDSALAVDDATAGVGARGKIANGGGRLKQQGRRRVRALVTSEAVWQRVRGRSCKSEQSAGFDDGALVRRLVGEVREQPRGLRLHPPGRIARCWWWLACKQHRQREVQALTHELRLLLGGARSNSQLGEVAFKHRWRAALVA